MPEIDFENLDFPVYKETHRDRLFKHITFPESNDSLTLRILPVNRNAVHEYNVIQKRVPIDLSETDGKKPKLRLKAVLKNEDHGVLESYWVTEKSVKSATASTHNQFRIRSVAKSNYKSDWVYSEIRDDENDLIVYNMIYDILELLLSVQDDQIEYLLDHIVADTFKEVLYDRNDPDYEKMYSWDVLIEGTLEEKIHALVSNLPSDIHEDVKAGLEERILLFAHYLKTDFVETLTASPEEFAELYRSYEALDQYREQKTDFLGILLDIFLEEQYEELVQKSDLQVYIQNQEEIGIYLNGEYKFDIKNELIKHMFNLSFSDKFVTALNDAVQLLSEPIVYESLVYQQDEEVARFIKMAIADLYIPLETAKQEILLETDLEDEQLIDSNGRLLEIDFVDKDGNWLRNMLVYDILEAVIKGDLDITDDVYIEFIDKILERVVDHRLALSISYSFEEIVGVFSTIGERFRHAYNTLFGEMHDRKDVRVQDHVQFADDYIKLSFVETQKIVQEELASVLLDIKIGQLDETKVGLIDELIYQYGKFKEAIAERLNVQSIDSLSLQNLLNYTSLDEKEVLEIKDQLKSITSIHGSWTEEKKTSFEADHLALFKAYLLHPNKFRLLETLDARIEFNPDDTFIFSPDDNAQYALGWTKDGWPVGKFILGVNTLKGEVNPDE